MVETTGDPSVSTPSPEAAPEMPAEPSPPPPVRELSLRSLLEAGSHFGHQTRRWDPRMRRYIYGERNGIHILDLDVSLPLFQEALDFLRETVASGGKILFAGTKRQAQAPVQLEAARSGQFYVNNRWLGGTLTNFRTVKKSIDRFKEFLAILGDEEKMAELSKKELARVTRAVGKYRKSLDGIKEMTRLPEALFVIDVNREHIAISEARRLNLPIVAIVDSNCNPEGIDYVIPANDDAIRAIQLYCELVADACLEGAELFNERIQAEQAERGPATEGAPAPGTGRVVVEMKQPPRRGRGGAGGTYQAGPRRPREEVKPAAEPASEPKAASEPKPEPAPEPKPESTPEPAPADPGAGSSS